MIGEIFRAGTGALDDLQQQQENAERQKHVGKRYRPLGAGHQRQLHHRLGERYAGHQEDDDVVDRERNQKKRKTDHGHRRGLPFQASASIGSAAGNLLSYWLAEFRPPGHRRVRLCARFSAFPGGAAHPGPNYDSFLAFRTWRPLYMPVFRSRWWGRRNSPESLSSI